MSNENRRFPQKHSCHSEVAAFLANVEKTPVARNQVQRGRLLFAMDATASRQPTWDRAAEIQGEMFIVTDQLGGLEIQLCFYRGFGEFHVSPWLSRSADLLKMMTSVTCRAGQTQIGKVLQHAINQTKARKVNALVFVGDCVEEDVDRLGSLAGELSILGVPAFMFHEGNEPVAAFAFKEIARLTGGAYVSFDAGSARQLKELLAAVAVYAAGGRPALDKFAVTSGRDIKQIAHQLGRR